MESETALPPKNISQRVRPLLLSGVAFRINKLEGVGINAHLGLINNDREFSRMRF